MRSDRLFVGMATAACYSLTGVVVAGCTFFNKAEPANSVAPAEVSLPTTWTAQDSASLTQQLNTFESGPWHDAPCDGCQAPGEVRIRSKGRTVDIKADSGPSVVRAVAEIQNQSGENVGHGPSGYVFKAHHTYLMWVSRQADHKATWGFFELGPALSSGTIGTLNRCHDPVIPPKINDANFYNCGDRHTSSFSFVKSAYASPRPPAAGSIPKLSWISCDPDCCTGTGSLGS